METGECCILIEAGTCGPGEFVEGLKSACVSLAIFGDAVETGQEILGSRSLGFLTEVVGTKPTQGRSDETGEGDNLAQRLKGIDAHTARLVGWKWRRSADDDQDKARSRMNKRPNENRATAPQGDYLHTTPSPSASRMYLPVGRV